MRKTSLSLLLITLLLVVHGILLPLLLKKSFAADLTNTYLRLDRMTASKTTGGLLCTTTPSTDNGTENSIQIIFPSSFTVNSSASNWTVNTSGLPSGATAWPGISTATSVNGQIVTFPSSNLSPSTQYCFNFSSSQTLTTPSSTGNYAGTVRTKSSSDTTIDSIDIGLNIASNDSITVTATAPAQPTDFGVRIEILNRPNTFFPENTELVYRIHYDSYLSIPSNIQVEAEWSLGTLQNSSTPSIGILSYVIGSATDAYGNSPAVIDVSNRRITWTISAFPQGQNEEFVDFRLRTNSPYTGPVPVDFTVSTRVVGPGTQTPDAEINSIYLYSSYITPTQSPTCSPGSCPTATPTASPLTVPAESAPPVINTIDIREVSASHASIFVNTASPTRKTIRFGANENNLSQSVTTSDFNTQHLVALTGLNDKTRYYFRVIALDNEGLSASSDLYLLDTATLSKPPEAIKNSIVISSLDIQLTNAIPIEGVLPNIIIPIDSAFAFRFVTEDFKNIQSIAGILRNDQVLGINTAYASDNAAELSVTEISPGQYVGKFDGYPKPGNYKLFLRLKDFNGNIAEQEIASVFIVSPLKIINALSKSGIENAKITLYYYNSRLKTYELIQPDITSIINPNRSGVDGVVWTILPEGKYKAIISVLGYEIREIEFDIKPGIDGYPVIELQPLPFNILTQIQYYFETFLEGFGKVDSLVSEIRQSSRYFELWAFGIITLFILLALAQISRIFGVPVYLLPFFGIYHLAALFHKPEHPHFIQGKIIDITTNEPIESALLHFASPRGKVFAHTRTNIDGDFTVSIKNPSDIKISISKKGFETLSRKISKEDLEEKLTVNLSRSERPERFGLGTLNWYFRSIAESFFETFLILTIIVELFFAQQFGFAKALFPLTISVANLLLWAMHARPKKQIRRRV